MATMSMRKSIFNMLSKIWLDIVRRKRVTSCAPFFTMASRIGSSVIRSSSCTKLPKIGIFFIMSMMSWYEPEMRPLSMMWRLIRIPSRVTNIVSRSSGIAINIRNYARADGGGDVPILFSEKPAVHKFIERVREV